MFKSIQLDMKPMFNFTFTLKLVMATVDPGYSSWISQSKTLSIGVKMFDVSQRENTAVDFWRLSPGADRGTNITRFSATTWNVGHERSQSGVKKVYFLMGSCLLRLDKHECRCR